MSDIQSRNCPTASTGGSSCTFPKAEFKDIWGISVAFSFQFCDLETREKTDFMKFKSVYATIRVLSVCFVWYVTLDPKDEGQRNDSLLLLGGLTNWREWKWWQTCTPIPCPSFVVFFACNAKKHLLSLAIFGLPSVGNGRYLVWFYPARDIQSG